MKRKTFCDCLEQIMLRFREKISPETIKIYWEDLKNIADADMVEATNILAKNYEYLPRNLTAFIRKTAKRKTPFQGTYKQPEPIPDEERLTREEIHRMFEEEIKNRKKIKGGII